MQAFFDSVSFAERSPTHNAWGIWLVVVSVVGEIHSTGHRYVHRDEALAPIETTLQHSPSRFNLMRFGITTQRVVIRTCS
jgi:hypothetical protein